MTKDDLTDNSRRNFLKGAAATGLTATGLTAVTGTASAQGVRNLQIGDVQVTDGGLLNISLQNVNVLRNVNIEDVVVTVIGGDVRILENATININDSLIEVNITDVNILNDSLNNISILNNSLNNNDVQVSVAVLGDAGNVLAAGDTIA